MATPTLSAPRPLRTCDSPSRMFEQLESRLLLSATIGGGTVDDPALGADPLHLVGEGQTFVLVKNWDFGTGDLGNDGVHQI